MKRKHKFTLSMAAALVMVLAIGCIALAANSKGLISYLFEGREPTEDAQNLIVEPQLSVEKNGVKLSIDEYIRDGNTLTILWSAESTLDRPLLYGSEFPKLTPRLKTLTEGSGIGFEELILLDDPEMGIQSSKRSQSTIRYQLDDSVKDKPILFDLTARFFTPEKEIKKGDVNHVYDDASEDPSYLVIGEYGFTRPELYASIRDKRGKAESDIDAFIQLGYIKPFEELSLSLEIEPGENNASNTAVDGKNTFEFDRYTLVIDTLDFGAASSVAKFYIIPKESVDEEELIWTWRTWYYLLTDSQGNDIMADMTGGWNGSAVDDDGVLKYCWEGSWGPLTVVPESVTIMPVEEFTFDGGGADRDKDYAEVQRSHFIEEEAVTVRLK